LLEKTWGTDFVSEMSGVEKYPDFEKPVLVGPPGFSGCTCEKYKKMI